MAGCGAALALTIAGGELETATAAQGGPRPIGPLLDDMPDNWGRFGDDDELDGINYLSGRKIAADMTAVTDYNSESAARFTLQDPITGNAIDALVSDVENSTTDTGDPMFPGRFPARRTNWADASDETGSLATAPADGGMAFADDAFATPPTQSGDPQRTASSTGYPASIEAARAGEAGEGFGVVADDIKRLAAEAADATAQIETQIEEVRRTTTTTVEEIEKMRGTVEARSETIEDVIDIFDDIATAVHEAENGIAEISNVTDDQAVSTAEVVSMVDGISSVSQQTASEASNASAATEEQTFSLSEASGNLQRMAALAGELREQVAQFEIDPTYEPFPSSTDNQSEKVGDGTGRTRQEEGDVRDPNPGRIDRIVPNDRDTTPPQE